MLKLVAKPREWSCSYGQLNLFVDACGAVLVGLAEGRYGLDHWHPLVKELKAAMAERARKAEASEKRARVSKDKAVRNKEQTEDKFEGALRRSRFAVRGKKNGVFRES